MTDFGWTIVSIIVSVILIGAFILSLIYCRDFWQSFVMDVVNW